MASTTSMTSTAGVTPKLAGSIVVFQLSGTFAGTVTFQSTVDGTNWISTGAFPIAESGTASTTATAAGIWRVRGAGLAGVRASCTAYTSGTIVVHAESYDHGQIAA